VQIRHRRDPFGVQTLYANAAGLVFDRIDAAGPTTLSDAAVQAWRDGTFRADTKLVEELTPLPLREVGAHGRDARSEAEPHGPAERGKAESREGDVRGEPPAAHALASSSDALTHALDTAVVAALPLPTNIPVHCLLSGGIDSAAIVDSLQRQGAAVIAHALVDDAVDVDELRRARALTSRLRVPLHEHRIHEEELPGFFAQAVIAAERPIFNARGVSLALFAWKLAQEGITQAFSGIGADEVFNANRPHIIQTLFEPKTLPPTVWAARHFGLRLSLPYLSEAFVSVADAAGPTENKRTLREAFAPRLGAEICFAAKSPRMFGPVARSALWRDVVERGDDAASLSAASFAVLKRYFAHGANPPRHLP
jgi:hypothetical protein